jgi:hypothetical protein
MDKYIDISTNKAVVKKIPRGTKGYYQIPYAVRMAAQLGLALQYAHGQKTRKNRLKGILRAGQLADGVVLHKKDIVQMNAYFARHEVDKKAANFNNLKKPSNGRIAWELWGGDAAEKWVKLILGK